MFAVVVTVVAAALTSCDRQDARQETMGVAETPTSLVVRPATETELRHWLTVGLLSGERVIDVERPSFSRDGYFYQGGNATISGQYLVSANTYCVYHSDYAVRLYCMDVAVGPTGLQWSESSPDTDIARESKLRGD